MRILMVLLAVVSAGCPADQETFLTPSGRIYFLSGGRHEEPARLHRVRPDGTGLEALTEGRSHAYVYERSPDPDRLVATIDNEVVLASADLSRRVVLAAAPGIDWHPRFSRNGDWILFESDRYSFRDLYKLHVETRRLIRLTNNREGNFDGAWSPDARRIAFASSRHGQLDLFVMNADGGDQVRLTRHPGDSVKPQWSPDGGRIAFLSGRDGRDEVYVVRPDGSNLEKVASVPRDARVERFAWHPSEPRLLYAVRRGTAGSKVWMTDLAGSGRMLSDTDADEHDPSWSPDGRRIVFIRVAGEKREIWTMNADGKDRRRLDIDVVDAWLPRWLDTKEGEIKHEALKS